MVRAPCCAKIGLKKGPWSPEEGKILISYIQKNGHGNWRALPKQAGLLRCGKSCRLRWINYLSPEIKRGNFTKEEEDSIIKLHETLGNIWSAIAVRLPGRTDNEIKNIWHTHLKKRLSNYEPSKTTKRHSSRTYHLQQHSNNTNINHHGYSHGQGPSSPPSSDMSSSVTDSSAMADTISEDNNTTTNNMKNVESAEGFLQIDESFWTKVLSFHGDDELQFGSLENYVEQSGDMIMGDDMDFWNNLLMKAGELSKLAEF